MGVGVGVGVKSKGSRMLGHRSPEPPLSCSPSFLLTTSGVALRYSPVFFFGLLHFSNDYFYAFQTMEKTYNSLPLTPPSPVLVLLSQNLLL